MSTTTTNLSLIKPELTDPADITALNPNWDKIDTELNALTENLSTVTPESIGAAKSDLSNVTGILPVEKGGTGKNNLNDVKVGSAEWASWATHMGLTDCSNKDFNTLKTPGYYFGYTGMANAAFNEICVLEVIPYTNDWVLQRQTRLTDGKMYFRYFSSGSTWSDWYDIYTSKHKPTASDIIGAAKIQTGSYTGTGTYGSDNPNKLTFNFQPKLVIIAKDETNVEEKHHTLTVLPYGLTSWKASSGNYSFTNTLTWGTNTVSWDVGTETSNAGFRDDVQLNVSGALYRWVAIG